MDGGAKGDDGRRKNDIVWWVLLCQSVVYYAWTRNLILNVKLLFFSIAPIS